MIFRVRPLYRFVIYMCLLCLITVFSAVFVCGQTASHRPTGVPEDWSTHHVVFSDPGTYEQAVANGTVDKWVKLQYDPRYIFQQMKRNGTSAGGYSPKVAAAIASQVTSIAMKPTPKSSPLKRDWSVSMHSTTATVGANNYPATYTYETGSPTTANCSGGALPDFVAYNTSVAGSATQASILAYDNLYSVCAGTEPLVYWAYDTGSTIETSVAESVDGTQFAFVHSASTASLVLLKWSATGGAFTGTTTTGSANVTVTSGTCSLVLAGEPVNGPTIPSGRTVSSCSGTTLVLSSGTGVTAGSTQPLTFNNQFTGTLASSTTVTVPSGTCSVTNIVGSPIYGTGIPQGDTVKTCSSTTLTLNIAATTSGSQTLTFNPATAAAPVVLTANSNANYKSCVAPCMTTINFSHADNDTLSSPFYDFTNDNIYVGDGGGYLYGFNHVFLGSTTPALGWATAVHGSNLVASPVYDYVSGYVYTVDYATNVDEVTTGGTIHAQVSVPGPSGGNNSSDIQEGPIVDGTAGKVYMFGEGATNNYVAQIPTNFTDTSTVTYVTVGASANSNSDLLYNGNFDNAYYTSSNGTGNLYVCGNNAGDATLYQIPITSGTISTTSNAGPALTSSTQQCSPTTEIYNTSGTVPYDWLFLGVRGTGLASGCASGACVMGIPINSWVASTTYALGQMIVNNHFNIEVVTTAGTSGGTQPTWPTAGTIGTVTGDGATLKWTSEGPFTFTAFQTSHSYSVNTVIVDSNNNLQRVTTAGTSGGSTPSWSGTFGNTTTSGGATFTNQGPLGITGSPSAGGTSGIMMDNTGTNGGSNIYFSTLTTNGDAISASQSAP